MQSFVFGNGCTQVTRCDMRISLEKSLAAMCYSVSLSRLHHSGIVADLSTRALRKQPYTLLY